MILKDAVSLIVDFCQPGCIHSMLLHVLSFSEPAYITANPKSKTRIAGQSVNFTCEAEETPPIEISW